jgi:hypothetical protein
MGLGALIRVVIVALMLGTTLLALPATTTARTTGPSGFFAQGSSQDVDPAKAAKTPESDDEDEDKKTPEDEDEDKPKKKKTPVADDLPEDWLDAGLISETEYESPQFGYAVEWDEPWVLDEWYDDPDNGENAKGTVVTEDDDSGADDLHIWVADNGTILRVQGLANENELTGEDYFDYWQSDDYLEGFASPAEMLAIEGDEEGAAAIYSLDSDNGMFIGYNQVIIADGGDTLIFLFFLAPVEAFEEGYGQAQEGVQVDGDEVFNIISNRDVEDVIEDLDI